MASPATAFASNVYVAMVLKGMQAGVAAVILDVVCGLGRDVFRQKSILALVLMAAAFIATCFLKLNVVYIILAAAVIGAIKAAVVLRREKGAEQ